MKPDKLFLSGGGVNCVALLGSFRYLLEHDIISEGFKSVKNIVCVSGSALYIIPLLLGYSLDATIKISIEVDNKLILGDHGFDLNNLFENFGLYDNHFFDRLISVILKQKNIPHMITLGEFYKHTNINLVFKTTNITKYKIEYMNHLSHPELPLIYAVKMTTCIPLLFTPIKYNNCLYVDGGLCGNYPIEYNKKIKSKNYIGIHIKAKEENEEITDILSYLTRLQMVPWSPYDDCTKNGKHTILITVEGPGTKFDKTKDQNMKLLNQGYHMTEKFYAQ